MFARAIIEARVSMLFVDVTGEREPSRNDLRIFLRNWLHLSTVLEISNKRCIRASSIEEWIHRRGGERERERKRELVGEEH